MDLIIKAREVTVNITVQGFLKVVSANEEEIDSISREKIISRKLLNNYLTTTSGIIHILIIWVYPLRRGV